MIILSFKEEQWRGTGPTNVEFQVPIREKFFGTLPLKAWLVKLLIMDGKTLPLDPCLDVVLMVSQPCLS
jgi:hypothetical protein